jgi:hypothetical protein
MTDAIETVFIDAILGGLLRPQVTGVANDTEVCYVPLVRAFGTECFAVLTFVGNGHYVITTVGWKSTVHFSTLFSTTELHSEKSDHVLVQSWPLSVSPFPW